MSKVWPKSPVTLVGKYSKDFSNLPDRYIERAMRHIVWENPKGVQYRKNMTLERKRFYFEMDRPWTMEFNRHNRIGLMHKKYFVEPIKEWSFFRGDRVEVLVGRDKGKQGFIKQIFQERNWVTVQGLNCKIVKLPDNRKFSIDTYIKQEQPLLVTWQIALVDPADLKPVEYEWRYTEEGDHVRVSKRTGRIIPVPPSAEETIDYKCKSTYSEQPKDTVAKEVTKLTFAPHLGTFEMDIMDAMGIKEDRIPPKFYWY